MEVTGLHHVSVLVSDTARALDFYAGVLGIAVDDGRPDLGFPGAWLQVGDAQIHLLQLPNPETRQGRPAHGGRDRHVALTVGDVAAAEAALQRAGVQYTRSRSGRAALFCRDPDGNAIELMETQPATAAGSVPSR